MRTPRSHRRRRETAAVSAVPLLPHFHRSALAGARTNAVADALRGRSVAYSHEYRSLPLDTEAAQKTASMLLCPRPLRPAVPWSGCYAASVPFQSLAHVTRMRRWVLYQPGLRDAALGIDQIADTKCAFAYLTVNLFLAPAFICLDDPTIDIRQYREVQRVLPGERPMADLIVGRHPEHYSV